MQFTVISGRVGVYMVRASSAGMETVVHDGRSTAYRHPRQADILYVHGSGATHRVWVCQYGRAAQPATALDLSGHGDSDDLPADTEPGGALDEYADDVVAVARETGADVLAGNSLGGAIVLWVALERAFDPAGLVLCGTGAKLSVHPDILEWLADDFDRAVSELHAQDLLFHDVGSDLQERSKVAMRETGQDVTARDYRVCDGFDVRDRLGDIDVPALAVCGEYDKLTPRWYHEYLAENMPDCEFVEISDAAHFLMLERPDEFNAVVDGFLDQI